jgi:hypothetical protein
MKPKGHKTTCKCAVCKNIKKSKRRRNPPSSEMGMQAVKDGGIFRLPRKRKTKRNSAIDISGNPKGNIHYRKSGLKNTYDVFYRSRVIGSVTKHSYDHWTFKYRGVLHSAGYMTRGQAANALVEKYFFGRPKRTRRVTNPQHFPKTTRGRKGIKKWFIFDIYGAKGRKLGTRIGNGTHAESRAKAIGLSTSKVGSRIVTRVVLSGPYSRKPTPTTKRK